jgi:hypothetical protein
MANEINFAAMPQTAIRVITAPAAFFREMPKAGGFVEPLIFALVLGCLAGIIRAVLTMTMYFSTVGMMALTSIVLMPIFIVIGCFIGAAILFVIWKLMGSQESFETAFRCAAYMSAISPITAVLGVIPWIGAVLGMLLSLYYVVMASVEVHGIPAKKAWIVFGSIIALLCLVSMCTQYAVKKATRNMEMNNKALQNYLDESSKAMQQKTEMMRQQSQQGQQMPQAQQGPQSQEQMQKQLQETQRQIEEMQRQMQQQKASGK